MAGPQLHLLEGFAFHTTERPVEIPVGTKRLLAFLALRGPSPRTVVAGTLWPDVPESHALASLRTAMWRLNKILPGLVRAEGLSLATAEGVRVDCREQESFATRLLREHPDADAAWVSAGVDTLWKRDLLPGWYDDWVVFERERLTQLRLHALEHAARLLLRRRDLDTALQLALEAVRTEPLRETATAVLMSVYLAEGNVVDAIRQRDVFTDLLRRELGLEPSFELIRLVPQPRRPSREDRAATGARDDAVTITGR